MAYITTGTGTPSCTYFKNVPSCRVDKVAAEDSESEECCICMEQKAEVILACVHSFCKSCIERW